MRRWLGWVGVVVGLALVAASQAGPLGNATPHGILVKSGPVKPCGQEQVGYCLQPVEVNGQFVLRSEPYYPCPGDILLYDFSDRMISVFLKFAGTSGPMHAAIVVERPDGTPAILEVGPNSKPQAFTRTFILDVQPRLENYPGKIMVRKPRTPLTKEQSAELTDFALAQQGKKFAVGRLILQGTPFRCRHGLRHMLFAETNLNRSRWICSENVVAAATVAGILDPNVYFANAMYPRDLAFDEHYDLSPVYHPPVMWTREPSTPALTPHTAAHKALSE